MLFERHIFRRETNGAFSRTAPQVSGPPGGYGTFASQYDRLSLAISLCTNAGMDKELALRSASWGIGQIMGFNSEMAGYGSADAMVSAFVEGEDAQILGMASFLKESGLNKLLQDHDWTSFARRYNGPSFATSRYDLKLALQYERFSSGSGPNLTVRAVQAALQYLGFSPGEIDGVVGPRSQKALDAFREATGLPPAVGLDLPTTTRLLADAKLARVN